MFLNVIARIRTSICVRVYDNAICIPNGMLFCSTHNWRVIYRILTYRLKYTSCLIDFRRGNIRTKTVADHFQSTEYQNWKTKMKKRNKLNVHAKMSRIEIWNEKINQFWSGWFAVAKEHHRHATDLVRLKKRNEGNRNYIVLIEVFVLDARRMVAHTVARTHTHRHICAQSHMRPCEPAQVCEDVYACACGETLNTHLCIHICSVFIEYQTLRTTSALHAERTSYTGLCGVCNCIWILTSMRHVRSAIEAKRGEMWMYFERKALHAYIWASAHADTPCSKIHTRIYLVIRGYFVW